jgi:tRNA threonylcarbamoyl adenosine modification protein (Sua5/YciO/YrdC/YwlC family)
MTRRLILHPDNPQVRTVRAAAQLIRDGGVIAYPTDSSYALGCSVGEGEAARRIRLLRGVDLRHHLTLVCADLAQVGRYARMDNWQFRIVRQSTPGCYTFLLPATREVPRRVQHPRRSTIGVRVPEHPVVQALLAALGEAILSSTLILPGAAEPLNDADSIVAQLDGRIEGVVDAGPCPAEPTTVVDLARVPPALIRLGRGELARLGIDLSAPAAAAAAGGTGRH